MDFSERTDTILFNRTEAQVQMVSFVPTWLEQGCVVQSGTQQSEIWGIGNKANVFAFTYIL